jgi:hypothetical protein
MTFLPIVIRELRVASRGKALYRARFWTAIGAVALGSYLMLMFRGVSPAFGGGRMIFQTLAGTGLFYCAALARSTADCISEEKREGTLGLLFLTDLRGYDVVLGKLCANSLKSFYGFIATFPVVSCALVLGGITGLEFFLVALALLNVFFFAHAVGLLVSVVSRKQGSANGGAAVLLVFFFLGIPALAAGLRYESFLAAAEMLEVFSPVYAYSQASALGARHSGYWTSLLAVHFTSWLFLGVAGWLLPRCWQDKPARINLRWKARFQQWCFGPPAFRQRLRLRLLEINPFLWLVSRNQLGSIMVWGFLGLVFCGWFWTVCKEGLADSMGWFVMVIIVNHTTLKFWIASETCTQLEDHRRSGALEILLSCTPISVGEIIQGQWLALRRLFLAPLLAVLAFDLVLIFLSLSTASRHYGPEVAYFVTVVFAAMIMLIADAIAIGWVGMWRAMCEKRPRRAAGRTATRLLFFPWLLMSLAGISGMLNNKDTAVFFWFILGIGIDIAFAVVAHDQLFTEFRARAAVMPEEPLGILGELGRFLGRMGRS